MSPSQKGFGKGGYFIVIKEVIKFVNFTKTCQTTRLLTRSAENRIRMHAFALSLFGQVTVTVKRS
jgi:hypothetical protein